MRKHLLAYASEAVGIIFFGFAWGATSKALYALGAVLCVGLLALEGVA